MYRRDERDTARASGRASKRAQRGKPIDLSEVTDENTFAMTIDKSSDLAMQPE
jgi:hypothetical protein